MAFTRQARRALLLGSLVVAACAQDVTVLGPPQQQGSGGPATPRRSLTLAPLDATISVGATLQMRATVQDSAGNVLAGVPVVWLSASPSVATVDTTGLVTGTGAGAAVVQASSSGITASSLIRVDSIRVASVSISPGSGTLVVGTTLQFTATLRDQAGNILAGRTITWTSSNPAVATVSTNGLVTAVAPGPINLTATSEGQSATVLVSVNVAPVAFVQILPDTATLRVGSTLQMTAVLRASDDSPLTGRIVTWATSDPAIATVSPGGVVTAVAPGTVTITATSEGVPGTATITVVNVPVGSVQVAPPAASLGVGATLQLGVTVRDVNGNVVTGRVVTWATSNAAVASVTGTGLVTAVAAGGPVTITATCEGVGGTSAITVSVPVAAVQVSPPSVSIQVGATVQLTATPVDANGNPLAGRVVSWSSSAPALAQVSATGLVTGIAAGGPITITATSEGRSGTAAATVTPVPVASVTVSPAATTVVVGSTTQLTATTRDANGNVLVGRVVTWATSDGAVATVSATGLVTAIAVGGPVTLTATSEGQSGTAAVTVSNVPVATVTVAPPTASIQVGATVQLTATPKDAGGNPLSGRVVTWATSNAGVATVSVTGLVTGVASGGPVTITATSEGRSGTAAVTVVPVPVATVTVTPASATIQLGATLQLTVVTKDANGNVLTGRVVTWASGNAAIASVTGTGRVTAAAVGGPVTITATSEGQSGSSAITVVPVPVASVAVSPATATVVVAGTQQLTATTRDANGNTLTGRVVTWATSNAAVATVSGTGLVTGVALGGPVTITATSEGINGTAAITVGQVPVATVTVSPAPATVIAGQTVQLTATTRDANGTLLTGRAIGWGTSNPAVATVSPSGLVTGVAVGGPVTITATSEGKTGTSALTVTPVPVATVTVSPPTATVVVGSTVQLTATTKDANGNVLTGRVVTWGTSNAAAATVNGSGLVTGVAPGGPVTITATSGGVNGTAAVTVTNVPVASVTVTPATATVQVGATAQLSVTLRDAGNNILTGRTVTWSTSNGTVATVSATGLVTGVAAGGPVTITATSEGVNGPAAVTVVPVPVATVTLSPAVATVFVGGTLQLTATTKDASGNVLTGRVVTWSTSNPAVATVSGTGLVTGAAAGGPVTITATSEGQSGTAAVTVSNVPVATVTVTPPTATVQAGATVQLTATLRDAGNNVLTGRTVTWTTGNAAGATVSASGLVTGVAAGGPVTITATSEGQTGTAAVTVTPVPVATVTVSPAADTLPVGATQQLTATTKDANGNTLTGRVITWTTSNGGVATVSGTGLVTAAAVGGPVTITATSEGQAGTSAITVVPVPVASVTVSPATANLLVAGTVPLAATTRDANGNILTGRAIAWGTSNATVATVNATGLVTGVAIGTATITATSEGHSGTAAVTVSVAPVASVTVTPATATIQVGATVQLTATPKDAGGNPLTGRVVTWTSANSAVAKVGLNGLVTGVAVGGPVTITASSEGASGTAAVTVILAPVATVSVSPTAASITVAGTQQLTATLRDAGGTVLTGRVVTWSSGAPGTATVSGTGLVTGVAVGGPVTITATSEGKTGTSAITVVTVPVATVTVSPAAAGVAVGATRQLSVTLRDASGNVLTGRPVTWSSSAPGVASVSGTGLVAGLVVGTATITATAEGKTGTSAITVPHAGYYVATNGSTGGTGSWDLPWPLQYALSGAGGRIRAGDTIWVRGGSYRGSFTSSLSGTATAPVVLRAYPGEHALLDGDGSSNTLKIDGSYTWFWGLDVQVSTLDRINARMDVVYVRYTSNVRLIHLLVHDGGTGIYTEPGANPGIIIYGCIVYNNGWQASSADRGHGHAIYIKNDAGSKLVQDNVLFNQFGFGFHEYSNLGSGSLFNVTAIGNVSFNNGSLAIAGTSGAANYQAGGEEPVAGSVLTDNMAYYSTSVTGMTANMKLGYGTVLANDVVFQNNYAVGGNPTLDVREWNTALLTGNTLVGTSTIATLSDGTLSGQSWSGNTYYRTPTASAWRYNGSSYTFSGWQSATGLSATDQALSGTPSGVRTFVRPSPYEPGRATVIVYNWALQGSVSVDLTGVLTPGDQYEVRSVQSLFGAPVTSGTYGGGTISIPMTGVTPATPIGTPIGSTPPVTGPGFDVFVVKRIP